MSELHSRSDSLRFEPKDEPLRRDVRVLGAQLGRILRDQGPSWLYETVEGARRAAIRRRADDQQAEHELVAHLAGLAPEHALEVTRAFSAYFGLVNLAEQLHRLRRREAHRRGDEPQPGSLEAVVASLAGRGLTSADLAPVLAELVVEPVLTAHPTEALRRTLLIKELRTAQALLERGGKPGMEAMRVVREELTAAWQTEEHRAERPSVADEREHALFFLGQGIWRAVPALRPRLRHALTRHFGEEAAALADGPRLRFGTWIGGDMDGNPAVGPDTLRASVARHAELVLTHYREELRELFRRLSQSRARVGASAELEALLADYSARLREASAEIPARYGDMPYRRLLWLISARIQAKLEDGPQAYGEPAELAADLETIAASLRANRGEHAGLRHVERLLERVRTFGFHLATLDVRQDALVHRRAAGELLGRAGFEELERSERTALLGAALAQNAPAGAPAGEASAKQLEVLRAVGELRARYGAQAVGLYIISMAQGPDDALALLLLARAAGLTDGGGAVPLDVVPLFETVEDLQRAPASLAELLSTAVWRTHLAQRCDVQWIMLGYSDSNKTSGLVPSRLALHRAQLELLAVAREHGVSLRFFHGRGGSISRGGAKPRPAILATPRGALAGHLRVTEQGEIIRAKYGLEGIAERTLELLLGATLERTALDRGTGPEAPAEPLLEEIGQAARSAYRALVEGDAGFLDYFQRATPIDAIERLGLGSRPARRREMRGIEDLRAIPWVFAWMQSRHILPGWYGAGSGLEAGIRAQGVRALRELHARSALFQGILRDVEMVLAKSDMAIAARYADLAGEPGRRVYGGLLEEWQRTRDTLLEVLEQDRLLAHDEVLSRAIRLRNPYIDPMSYVQVDLLARWRESGRADEEIQRALFATIHGIARGLQNTG